MLLPDGKMHYTRLPVRNLENSPVREMPEYAVILVFMQLFGGVREGFSFIASDSIIFHDYLATVLRKLQISYRTVKQKNPKKMSFTMYFQLLPDSFPTFRPKNAEACQAALRKWRWKTNPIENDRFSAIRSDEAGTIEWMLGQTGVAGKTVQRDVTWMDTVRPGWYVMEHAEVLDVAAEWKEDKRKSQVAEIFRTLTQYAGS